MTFSTTSTIIVLNDAKIQCQLLTLSTTRAINALINAKNNSQYGSAYMPLQQNCHHLAQTNTSVLIAYKSGLSKSASTLPEAKVRPDSHAELG